MNRGRLSRSRALALFGVGIVGAALLLAPGKAAGATPGAWASARSDLLAPAAAPVPVPIDQITPGLTGTGLTVSRGSTPEPFAVTVLGVLTNGIGSGVDLIVFEASSPALNAAGGIWAGMSGSPVYTSDGRLLGAVSYGFTMAPSMIGGMTPGVSMMELFTNPAAFARTALTVAALPDALRRDLVDTGQVSAAQAAAGLAPLPIPLSVSGLSANRLARVNADLERSGSPLRAYAGSAAPASSASAGSIFPGSNFVAALSYGDVTEAAIGTTTVVYGGKALAFGHPMLFTGPATMSAHQATALAVVPDATMGSFKLAAVGGIAGTVDADRMVGLRAPLGPGPAGVVPITSTVRFGSVERSATTWVTMDRYAADVTALHLMSNIDRVFDRVGPGRTELSWVIRGTRSNGTPWRLSRSNLYASIYDATWDSVNEISSELYAITENEFEQVKISDISVVATVRADYNMYTVDGVLALQGGTWVELTDGVSITPGQPLDLRVRLLGYRAPARLVDVRLDVPAEATGDGILSLAGMYVSYPETPSATSFADLLSALRNLPHNNQLVAQLRLSTDSGMRTVGRVVALDETVTGSRDFPVAAS